MKTFLLRFLLFIPVATTTVFFFVGATGVFFPGGYNNTIMNKMGDVGHLFTRLKEADTARPVDILVIGSSHAYRGVDPRIFATHGIRLFNLGSSAQTPIQTEVLLKRYFDRLKPKVVVVEVFPGVFCLDGVESGVDLISNSGVRPDLLPMTLRLNNLITYNSLSYNWCRKILIGDRFREPVCKNGECYIEGGFVQRSDLEFFRGRRHVDSLYWTFRGEQQRAHQRTMAFLHKRRCPVVLVQAPVAQALFRSYRNNRVVDDFFRSSGFPYYNFNYSGMGANNHLFYDQDHLNMDGVAQFNGMLLKILTDRQFFRQEPL